MAIGSAQLLGLAKELSEGAEEVSHRASVGRSYYAGYHALRGWHSALALPGSCEPGVGVHESFIQQLKNPAPGVDSTLRAKSKILGAQLSAFKLKRRVADYEMKAELTQLEAVQMYAQVELMLAKL